MDTGFAYDAWTPVSRRHALRRDAEISQAVRAASVAELAWLEPAGRPSARPVTPLWLADAPGPAIACTYAESELAHAVASASSATVVLSDPRMTGSDWRPVALTGRFTLIEDRTGHMFVDRLLGQELRKYPPSRAYADSPLLRREHWWYLPRLILVMDVEAVTTVGARSGREDHVLALATGTGAGDATSNADLLVDTVRDAGHKPRAAGGTAERHGTVRPVAGLGSGRSTRRDQLRLFSLTDRTLPDGPAALLGHDFSVPDLERWTPWVTRGRLRDGVLHVQEHPERTTLEPVPGVWQRLQRQRRLEKACRRALAG